MLIALVGFALVGCADGAGSLGDRCSSSADCGGPLQCVADVCVPLCSRAPDCGDGYACDANGICQIATGQAGNACTSQVDCAAGLACELDGSAMGSSGLLLASCEPAQPGAPPGDTCGSDADCRDGTCALGHCVSLCDVTRDCPASTSCTLIPRVDAPANGAMFSGCLQSAGVIQWTIPVNAPTQTVLLASPASAVELAVTFQVDDPDEEVGAVSLVSPSCATMPTLPSCDVTLISPSATYAANYVRHEPALGESVMLIPSEPANYLEYGAYSMQVSSLRPIGSDSFEPGTATPQVTVVAKLDTSAQLDLHFHFLNFTDHPCSDAFGGSLNASVAQTATFFQSYFVGSLKTVFAHGGVALGTLTYDDILDHPELDGLDVGAVGSLLELGTYSSGVNVFFVRTLSPSGLQAFGPTPNPGPAGLAGTAQSGIVIGLDTLCYRSWTQVARIAAYELAHYMGLFDDVDPNNTPDPLGTGSSTDNLMFYSELGGTDLTPDQRNILERSAVMP